MPGHKKGRKGHGHHKGGHKGRRHNDSSGLIEHRQHRAELQLITDPQVRLVTARLRGMTANPLTARWLEAQRTAPANNAVMDRIRAAFRPSQETASAAGRREENA